MRKLLVILLSSFLTIFGQAQTTVFTTQAPADATNNDGLAIELGMKFRTTIAGYITGVRFYKTTGNTGTHTGELYSSTGTRLAQAVFSGETALGWQTVTFSTPVAVLANTTYIAAYFSGNGNFAISSNYMTGAVTNSNMTGLANGTDGPNDVYVYATTPSFPDQTGNGSNYWVDAIWVANPANPVANAGQDQIITLPTNSATLDGSASAGVITSYLWTLISGPNIPNITTPANTISTVTGLIQGTYTFQLGVNGGSTDQMTITVLPQSAGTNFSFSVIPFSSADIEGPGRGAEQWIGAPWNNTNDPYIPAGNSTPMNKYYRFLWGADIEQGAQGVYNWTIFDNQINAAIDAGQMFSFGVMPMCGGCGYVSSAGTEYPAYLHTLMQAEAANSRDWQTGGRWIPNWNSPNYIGRYSALLNAIAAHIASGSRNGVAYSKVIYYVDIRGYGDYGEWHTYDWTGSEPTGRAATSATLKTLMDINSAAFPNYPNIIIHGGFDTQNASQMPADVAYYALTAGNAWGQFGWRRDNYGDSGYDASLYYNPGSYNPGDSVHHFSYLVQNKWKYAPVVGEPSADNAAVIRDCGTRYCDLPGQVRKYHTTSFGNGNYPASASSDPVMVSNLIEASKWTGYRIVLTGGSVTSTLLSGNTFTINLNWQNVGVAPTYENWKIVYQLKNGSSVVVWTGISKFNIRNLLPSGSATVISDNFILPSGLSGGNYSLFASIVDPLGYKAPLPLAITGRLADGSYLLKNNISISSPIPSDSVTLIIIHGEDNASGFAKNASALATELAPRSTVKILNNNSLVFENLDIGTNNEIHQYADSPAVEHGLELGMANEVDSGKIQNPVYLVKWGGAGSYIAQWLPGSTRGLWEEYTPFLDAAITQMNALGKPYRIFVWQSIGLNDRYQQSTTPANFMAMMQQFRTALRNRYSRPDIRFLSANFNNPPAQTFDWSTYFTQMAQADAGFHSIPVIGSTYISGSQGVNWDYLGFKLIAHNMTDTMLNLISTVGSGSGNQSPVANILFTSGGSSITLPTNSVGFNGATSTDADGSVTAYLWTMDSGPNTPPITTPTASATSVTGLIQGTYTFRLTVTDNQGATGSTTQIVVVNGSNPSPPCVGCLPGRLHAAVKN